MGAALMNDWGTTDEKAMRSYRAAMSNGQGRMHEMLIEGGCRYYLANKRAHVIKTPEPFRVISKNAQGIAKVRFTAHAEPDFIGSLDGGSLIAFEAKFTNTARIQQNVVTKNQAESLTAHQRLGAYTCVCVGIQSEAFMVPWKVFRNMSQNFGHKYATADDIRPWQVKNDSVVKFLDYVDQSISITEVG